MNICRTTGVHNSLHCTDKCIQWHVAKVYQGEREREEEQNKGIELITINATGSCPHTHSFYSDTVYAGKYLCARIQCNILLINIAQILY